MSREPLIDACQRLVRSALDEILSRLGPEQLGLHRLGRFGGDRHACLGRSSRWTVESFAIVKAATPNRDIATPRTYRNAGASYASRHAEAGL